ncbi:MAG TPA: fructosamine kinase family protein [Puia sp.]|jgi:fructosamine-3-kinase|nr:fructosamine kinase family protein [Puia sp.]
MPFPPAFITHLQDHTRAPIRKVTRIHGGHINRTYRLTTPGGPFLIKVNSAVHFPDMFAMEAKGLRLLADSHTVSTPSVLAQGNWEDLTYLLMEWIEPGEETPAIYELLGRGLAALHRHSALRFGLEWDHRSWMTQSNTFHDSWPDFFIQERLAPTLSKALERGNLTAEDRHNFEKLYPRIRQLFPEEPPALLHGDLWKGNCIFAADGHPYLIDPNVYYGHREMDIAMTYLLGGFDPVFYHAYNEQFPLEKDWQQRIDLCNLYPLLILTVFGPDYRDRLRRALKKYI